MAEYEHCQRCMRKNCKGYVLLHPKELEDLSILKSNILEEYPNAEFELIDSPSSGEFFTKFKEMHILEKVGD